MSCASAAALVPLHGDSGILPPSTAPKDPSPCALIHSRVYKQGVEEKPGMGSGGDSPQRLDTVLSHQHMECSELFILAGLKRSSSKRRK